MRTWSNLQPLFESHRRENSVDQFNQFLSEGLAKGDIKPHELSIRDIFEGTVYQGKDRVGAEIVREWSRTRDPQERTGLGKLHEAGVSTTHFSSITKQLLSTSVLDSYTDAAFIGDQLCRTVPTTAVHGERVPGLGRIGDEAEAIGEGQEYPLVGFGEDFIQTPETIKRGLICPVTKEAIIADRTGQILERAREVGYWIGYQREVRILNVVLGIVSTYNRLGRGVVATYGDNSGSHDWDNLVASNALVDWTDINNIKLAFSGMRDPNTGTPIVIAGTTLVVPRALEATAMRIKTATSVETVDNQANATTFRTVSGNPASGMNVLCSDLVASVTSSDTTYFAGDFPKAFEYLQLWPVTTAEAPTNNEMEFTRDIAFRFKASERGVAHAKNPRYAVKCTA